MIKFVIAVVIFIFICFFAVPITFAASCDSTPPPAVTSPGGGNPDDTYAVDSGFINPNNTIFFSDPNVVKFQNGFYEEFSSFLSAFKKSAVYTDAASSALDLLSSTPLLVIPSGGFYGYDNSAFFKAVLDEYVKQCRRSSERHRF